MATVINCYYLQLQRRLEIQLYARAGLHTELDDWITGNGWFHHEHCIGFDEPPLTSVKGELVDGYYFSGHKCNLLDMSPLIHSLQNPGDFVNTYGRKLIKKLQVRTGMHFLQKYSKGVQARLMSEPHKASGLPAWQTH